MVSGEQAIVNQLCKLYDEMKQLRILTQTAEKRTIDVYYITVPEDGGTRVFESGITKVNFRNGTIINPDGSTESLQRKLDLAEDKAFMHSISIYADHDIKFRLNTSGQQTVYASFLFQLPYVTYYDLEIECTETTSINMFACTNPQATLGNFKVTTVSDINQDSIVADIDEAQTWDDLLTLKHNLNRIRHQIVAITGEAWGTVSNNIVSLFDTTTGHDHDGTDSKKVDAGNVINTPAGDIVATDIQAAINELDTEKETPAAAQDKVDTHVLDTSVHGVAEVADVATVSAEIDGDIGTHAGVAINVHGVGVGNQVASDDDIVTHEADTSTHGVAEVADVATVSAEIDSDVSTHSDVTINVHGVGAGNHVASDADIATHADDTSTHGVTGAILGTEDKNVANGVAGLDANADIPLAQIPDTLTGKEVQTSKLIEMDKQSFTNLLDGDFELWSAGANAAPDGWTAVNLIIAQETTPTPRINTYIAKITANGTYAHLQSSISNYERYKNRQVTLGCWVYALSGNDKTQRIGVKDGVGESISDPIPKDNAWHWVTLTRTVNASAGYLQARLFVSYSAVSDTNDILYADGAILVEGSVCPAFSPKPLSNEDKDVANGIAGLDASVEIPVALLKTDVADGIAGLDANGFLNFSATYPFFEDYSNHLGVIDNFLNSGSSGVGTVSEDAANHEIDLDSNTMTSGGGTAYIYTKTTYPLSSVPLIVNYIVQNIAGGAGGDRRTLIGFDNDIASNSTYNCALFEHDVSNVWKAVSGDSSSIEFTSPLTINNGDLLTIFLLNDKALFYINGVLVATHTTYLPVVDVGCGAYVRASAPGNVTAARTISIDMISFKKAV